MEQLDDSFTEKFLNRRKARTALLNSLKADTPVGKKRAALVEEQQLSNQGVSNTPPKESPKRQCIEHVQRELEDEIEKENIHMDEDDAVDPYVPFKASSSKGLAALRRKNAVDMEQEEETSNQATLRPEDFGAQSVRSLGSDFEKNSSMPLPVKKGNIESGSGSGKLAGRLDVWNQAIKATMETEELVKSSVKKVTKFHEKDSVKDVDKVPFQKEILNSDARSVQPLTSKEKPGTNNNGIEDKKPNALNKSMDPAELPLSARKALFENSVFGGNAKSSGQAIEPKLSIAQRAAMFEKAANVNSRPKPQLNIGMQKRVVSQSSLSPAKQSPVKMYNASATGQSIPTPPPPPPPIQPSPVKKTTFVQKEEKPLKELLQNSPVKKMNPAPILSPLSPSKEASNHIRLVQQQLVERAANNWQEKDIVAKAVDERKKEIFNLVNRHKKRSSSSSVGNNASEEEQPLDEEIEDNAESEEEYASEYTESEYTEMESEYTERETEYTEGETEYTEGESEFEFERIQQHENVMESSISDQEDEDPDVFNHEDEELSDGVEPAGNENRVMNDVGHFRHPEHIRKTDSSGSASLKSSSVSVGSSCASNILSCGSSSSSGSNSSSQSRPPPVESSGDKTPLQYTVSFYRKQKQATRTPPMKTIVRREQVESSPTDDNKAQIIQERIKALQEEIIRQQTIIGQTSQALNLCHTTAEFSGSSEQVEGERLLLIATQKRQACLNEIQRLKSHGAQGENIAEGTGTLTITDIQLPLKREFISAQLEGKLNDAVHCFLCLIRHGAQVIVTQMVSTSDKISDGALCFTNHIKLQNLPPDVSVVFEVYALQTRKEQLPHDKKYHIKREQSKIRLTPKGKKADGKLILPAINSPGGPNAVRSPTFGVVGFTRFTIQNCHKKCFTLDKVPFSSPLEGILKVRLQLHAEHKVTEKGFLTMFEVVTGFGAWHRRWCYLNSQYLLYWKYPDDEHKKEPIGMIDLKKCVTGQVKLIARDICARPHTFELVMLRPREKGDKNLSKEQGNPLTTTKHLLSADTKEERILWCNKLNEALTNVRKWDPQALRPIETEQSTCTFPSSK